MEGFRDRVVSPFGGGGESSRSGIRAEARHQDCLTQLAEPRNELADLVGRLSLPVDDLRGTLPHVTVAVELGKVGDALHRKLRQRLRRVGDGKLAALHALEQLLQPVQVHASDLYERAAKSMRRGHAAPSSFNSRDSESASGAATIRPAKRRESTGGPGSRNAAAKAQWSSRSTSSCAAAGASSSPP